MLLSYCQTALSAAHAALPAVARYHLAGGPDLALTCHMVAVYPAPFSTGQIANCAFQPVPAVMVVYAKDCYPLADPERQPALPAVADLDAWTAAYLADVEALWDGLIQAVMDGQFGGSCAGVTVQPGNFAGPRGGVCSVRFPIIVKGV